MIKIASLTLLVAMGVLLAGCPEEKKDTKPAGSATAATTASAAPKAADSAVKPAGSGW
jgi:hypothetical protein